MHYDPLNNTWDGIMGDTWGPYASFVPEFRGRGFWYVIWGAGPDGDHDFAGWASPNPGDNMYNKGTGMAAFYDPTNGIVSSGDIVRLGPGGADVIIF
jgi:hypothetical protein